MATPNPDPIAPTSALAEVEPSAYAAEQLDLYRSAFEIQRDLLTNAAFLKRTSSGTVLMKALLQKILQTIVALTDAEQSSLFLLGDDGRITESILARGPLIQDLKQSLIGRVLNDGLAGWVYRQRQTSVIEDTTTDDRWLQLPSQPYAVRSALGVPLMQGQRMLALVTLMHSQRGHFTPAMVQTLELNVGAMASIIALMMPANATPPAGRTAGNPAST